MTTLSPAHVRPERWRLLSRYREGERTLAEWTSIFEGFPPEDYPLIKIEGSRARSILCPDSGYALAIYAHQDGSFSATPPPDSGCDTWIEGLTLEELRLYRFDWPALCRSVADELSIAGEIRQMPELPWFWRLGELDVKSQRYTCFFAVCREDAESVVAFLRTMD